MDETRVEAKDATGLRFKLSEFEGPLELLLSLIEERRLDITRVSLSEVTDQFLAYIARERGIPIANLASFILIAAKLILIKSKMLLPVLEYTDEEEESIEDLEDALREYRRFKEASLAIGALLAATHRSFVRERFQGCASEFSPPRGITSDILRDAAEGLVGEIEREETIEKRAIEEVVSLEEKLLHLQTTLATRAELSFKRALVEAKNRMEVIVSFLAVLELVKQRVAVADQTDTFGDIRVRARADNRD